MREPSLWILSISNEITKLSDDRCAPQQAAWNGTMFPAPKLIWRAGRNDYRVQIIRFGLYNRDQVKMTPMDKVKVKLVVTFMELISVSWDKLCDGVVGSPEDKPKFFEMYDEGMRDTCIQPDVARTVLTLDAVFLTLFLTSCSYSELREGQGRLNQFRELRQIFDEVGVASSLHELFSDVWLLQNQIPLELIRNVMRLVKDLQWDALIKASVIKALRKYKLPFVDTDVKDSFDGCEHLLECLYRCICPGIEHTHTSSSTAQSSTSSLTWAAVDHIFCPWKKRPSSPSREELPTTVQQLPGQQSTSGNEKISQQNHPNSLMTVSDLQKSGIRVKGVEANVVNITFKRSRFLFTATLYLPKIGITVNTQRILRNLCAYELGKSNSANNHKLLSYFSLLDDLINTAEDAGLLRKAKDPVFSVSLPGEDPDQQVANLFNNLLTGYADIRLTDEVRDVQEHVRDTFDVAMSNFGSFGRLRHEVERFGIRLQDRPWLMISLLAATVLLILTGLQTAYSILSFYRTF